MRTRKIKDTVIEWYMVRAKEYIKARSDKKLALHTPDDVESYFQEKGRDDGLQSWLFFQVAHAIQILFQSVIKSK